MATFQFMGKEIYYETYGEGKPLVVLNGIMMSTASWAPFIEPFSAANRLILLDMLEQGRSSKLEEGYTHDIQVDALKALLDELELEKVSIMGISYGGSVAMKFALKYHENLDRLLLFNAAAWTSPWLRDIGRAWNKAAADGEAYYYTAIPVIYSPQFFTEKSDWMEKRREALIPIFNYAPFMDSMVRLTSSTDTYDIRGELHKIKAPTLVVSSEFDFITPVTEQQLIASQIPNASYVTIPGAGHASMYEKPMLFASLVLGFVNNPKTEYAV